MRATCRVDRPGNLGGLGLITVLPYGRCPTIAPAQARAVAPRRRDTSAGGPLGIAAVWAGRSARITFGRRDQAASGRAA
jgi:hypothetical protein